MTIHSLAKGVWDNVTIYTASSCQLLGQGDILRDRMFQQLIFHNQVLPFSPLCYQSPRTLSFSPSDNLISTAPTWRHILLLEFCGPRRQEGRECVEWLTGCSMLNNQCAVDDSWGRELPGSTFSRHGMLLLLFSTHSAVYCYAHLGLWSSCLSSFHLPSFFQGLLMVSGPLRALLVIQGNYEFIYLLLYVFCYF